MDRRRCEHAPSRPLMIVLMAALIVFAPACGSGDQAGNGPTTSTTIAATSTTTTAPPGPAIRSVDLRSGAYRVPCTPGGDAVEARPSQPPDPTAADRVTVSGFEVTYGDVTGDGHDDAIIAINCALGETSAVVSSIVLVVSGPDGIHQIGSAVEGYHPVAMGSTVSVARAVYAEGDPQCCPSSIRYVPLSFRAGQLAEVAAGRASPLGTVATTTGVGRLQVGRTYAALAARIGRPILVSGTPGASSGGCASVTIEGGSTGISGLGDIDRLHTVAITDRSIRIRPDVGVGSTEAQVTRAFPDQVRANPDQLVPGGRSIAYTPVASPEHVAVFDTAGDKIVGYRVGDAAWAPVSSCR